MSAWGRKRQAIIIAYLILGLIIITAFFYFFVLYNPPSCFDGKQNGLEEGVDCGGACTKVCSFKATSPNIVWARSFEVGPGVYNMAAYIENPNFEIGTTLQYTLRGFNKDNMLVAEVNDSIDLAPRERRIIFHQAVSTDNRKIERSYLTFEEGYSWYKDEAQSKVVEMIGYRLDKLETSPSLEVDLRNTGVDPLKDLEIIVVLYNQDENVEHISRTYVDHLVGTGERTVFFSWRKPFDNFIARVEIFTRLTK
ncbi:MAG: hypothetical protein ACKKL4_02525 [Patescibacteria group bacterium]